MTATLTGELRLRVKRSEVIRTGFSRAINKPYTLFRLHAVIDDGTLDGAAPPGELRTFDGFDTATHTVTLEEFEPGVYTVKKVRTAADVRKRRSEARAAITGQAPAPTPEPFTPSSDGRIPALEERVTQLEARIEVLLSIVNNPTNE